MLAIFFFFFNGPLVKCPNIENSRKDYTEKELVSTTGILGCLETILWHV